MIDLSENEKRVFVRDGALLRRKLVPISIVRAALRIVEDWYVTSLDPNEIDEYTQKTFAPSLGAHPDLLNVYYQPGLDKIAGSLVAPDRIQPVSTVQVQIRTPEGVRLPQSEKSMHVDGVACPHLDPKELRTFTLLIGVLLTEVKHIQDAPLRYLPSAHFSMAEWFRNGWKLGASEQVPADIAESPGIPFLGEPGDAILLHHLIPHGVGTNKTTKPRVMLYFRIKHEFHNAHLFESLTDPWLEFPSLRNLSSQAGQSLKRRSSERHESS